MRIAHMAVENLLCVRQANVPLSDVTALVGRNGAGKSTLIRALRLFYEGGGRIAEEDFYARDTSSPIAVEVTWDRLTEPETAAYGAYVDRGTLTVRKEMPLGGDASYHGSRLQYEPFGRVRACAGARDRINAYNELVTAGEVTDLTETVRSSADAERAMDDWEGAHPELCTRALDSGKFFGFKNVGVGLLLQFTKLVYVPAVRDAADDAVEGRDNPLSQLIEMIVRSALKQDREISEFRAEVADRYAELFSVDRLPQLRKLGQGLTEKLRYYASNAAVNLDWDESQTPDIPLPKAIAALEEDGFPGEVSRKGHGLQRAFILTLLQFLAALREPTTGGEDAVLIDPSSAEEAAPSMVLAIEEPELYQHPSRQRRFASVLRSLSGAAPDGAYTQVIYSTHAPHFVNVQYGDDVRLVRKVHPTQDPSHPMCAQVSHASLDRIAADLERARGTSSGKFTAETLRPHLVGVMTPLVNEGFFADVVVLVEGESDRAALLGTARLLDEDLDAYGVVVVPVIGKANLDRPFAIFDSLGIPCYVVFDGDKDKGDPKGSPHTNELLLRLLEAAPVPFPETQIQPTYACFEENREKQTTGELGIDAYREVLASASEEFGYNAPRDAEKNPVVVARALELARDRGLSALSLEQIIGQVIALSPLSDGAAL